MRRGKRTFFERMLLGLWLWVTAGSWSLLAGAAVPASSRPERVATQYALTSAPSLEYPDPRHWSLLGSKDGGQSWEVLDTRTNQVFTERCQRRVFSLTNQTAFSTYRLVVTRATSVQLAELELIGPVKGVASEADLRMVASASREHALSGPSRRCLRR